MSVRFVLHLAHLEALRFNHESYGSEHLTLGLVKLGKAPSLANAILASQNIELRKVRLEVEKRVTCSPCMRTSSHVDLAEGFMELWDSAINLSRQIGEVASDEHGFGTGGLLIAMAMAPGTIAHEALMVGCGLDASSLIPEATRLLNHSGDESRFFDLRTDKFHTVCQVVRSYLGGRMPVGDLIECVPEHEGLILSCVESLAQHYSIPSGAELIRRHELYCELDEQFMQASDFTNGNILRKKIDALGLYFLQRTSRLSLIGFESDFWKAMLRESAKQVNAADRDWRNAVLPWCLRQTFDRQRAKAGLSSLHCSIDRQIAKLDDYVMRLPTEFAPRFERFCQWQEVRKDRFLQYTRTVLNKANSSENVRKLVRQVQRTQGDDARAEYDFTGESSLLFTGWSVNNGLLVPAIATD